MTIQSLEIHFRGICTHFHHNFVAGIPHRVVLPNATHVIPGLLAGPFLPSQHSAVDPVIPANWIKYLLPPHAAKISLVGKPDSSWFSGDGLADNGTLLTASQLQIPNAIDDEICYEGGLFTQNVPQLTTYLSSYVPSDDVVLGGRASAYFDLFGGRITAFKETAGETIRVKAIIATDGPPLLQVTPLEATTQPVKPQTFQLNVDAPSTLIVGNVGDWCIGGMGQYDFLLHYLTARSGIPREISSALPGMDTPSPCTEGEMRAALMEIVEAMISRPGTKNLATEFMDLSASCSDSRYP
jgi:hypothetical protein